MSEPVSWAEAEADYLAARAAYDEAAKKATAEFHRLSAPAKADAAAAIARIEAEYANKVREAKGELSAVTRRVKAQLSDFRLTRDALVRAEERKLEGLISPAKNARRSSLAHLKAMSDESYDRYHKLRWP